MKACKRILSVLLVLCLFFSLMPASAMVARAEEEVSRGIHNTITIDDDSTGGYEGDYVVIYNPSTSSSTSYSTGNMSGLIETTVNPNVMIGAGNRRNADSELPFYKIDVDAQMKELAETVKPEAEPVATRASYKVGDTKTFRVYASYYPTGNSSVSFECLYVGSHCYIWTPVSSANNTYPLDEIDSSFAKLAADEFDSKFDLMQSSFGNHTNGSSGDGKLHMLYYNINDGWEPGQGYIAGFFYQVDISNNGLPILNIDTYPGVYYKNSSGTEFKRMDDTYNTMVHEYQHLINYSNTSSMSTWLNECFSAAAEEICYPGSSVVSRIQSWENYYYSDNNDWLNPPAEFEYNPTDCPNLHNGYSMYGWSNNITDVLALYSQVSFFAQYLYTRFGNTIYKQVSDKYTASETSAITSATGVNCADLVRDFRVAVTANATQDQYNGIYGFKVQNGYDPSKYNDVQNPWNLLSPVIFTGSSCSIKGGGAITVKPVNGVYNPPSGASSNLKYIGIKLSAHQHSLIHVEAEEPTCVDNGNIEYWFCEGCGKYFSDAEGSTEIRQEDTVLLATGDHDYGVWTSNNNGTHSRICAVCDYEDTENCSYSDVVTPPTAAEQGFTTHTCTVCGYSYVDSYTDPLGNSYLVSFSVPDGVPAVEAMSCRENESITLPTAGAPEGYSFLGWVVDDYDHVDTLPGAILTGSYAAAADITLKALYSRTDTSAAGFERVSSVPADWTGDYVITYGESADNMYVLKGLEGTKRYETISAGGAVAMAEAGLILEGEVLTNADQLYVFRVSAGESKYNICNAATGTYLASRGSYLYSYKNNAAAYCGWELTVSGDTVDAVNPASRRNSHLGFSANRYFMVTSEVNSGISFWKLTGASSTTVYTTVID